MYKRITSLLIITCLILTACISVSASGRAAYPRNGFRLVPLKSDHTGIAVDTEFLLETEEDFSLEEVKKAFSIDGEPDPVIKELDKNFFSIQLSRPLIEDSIYTFRMKTETETTWVFQTQTQFKIIGAFPGNETVGVPVNTAIEVVFSHENFSSIENHFEITPSVPGRFQVYNGKTAVFIPDDNLEYETIYTVRIKKGIRIINTDRIIEDDYVFSFETIEEPKPTPPKGEPVISINYNRQIIDFSTESKIQLPLYFYISNTDYTKLLNLNTSVYAYKDFESFYEAVMMRNRHPDWAQINYRNNLLPVDGLKKILEFDQLLNEDGRRSGNAIITIPENLPLGYYIVDSYCEDKRAQIFLQITNTSAYITKATSDTLVWLNDIKTKKPLKGALIGFSDNDNTFITDDNGISVFSTQLIDPVNKEGKYSGNNYFYDEYYNGNYYWPDSVYNKQFLFITTADGNKSLLETSSYSRGSGDYYWRYFFTDREMYKSNDTVNIWGFIKNRYEDEDIDYITLELYQGYYYDYYDYYYYDYYGLRGNEKLPVIKKNIGVKDNFFEDKIELPNLPTGYYTIRLKKGNSVIVTKIIEIKEYIKPSYKMEIDKDKSAVFVGEEVNFQLNAKFFEGTGVSNLNTIYTISTSVLTGDTIEGTATTDASGKLNIKYVPEVTRNIQGVYTISLNARSLLPEAGDIRASNSVRVFVNDIEVKGNGKIEDEKGYVEAEVYKIVLDRLNDGTASGYNDYLGDAVEGKSITGKIYLNTWVKEKKGTYYDPISKVTYNTYTSKLETKPIKDFSMITGKDGKARYVFDAPEIKDSYYTAEIYCKDSSGRNISHMVYIGKRISYSPGVNNRYTLTCDKEKYGIGEEVKLDFTFANDNLPFNNYIYILTQNGFLHYHVSDSSTHSFEFLNEYIPNVYATAVAFTGISYVTARKNIVYDINEKEITIEGKTDKDSYRPGDTVNLNVYVKDKDGNPVKSTVNISIVDEAFFALKNQRVNVLSDLFIHVNSGIYFDKKSHNIEDEMRERAAEPPVLGAPPEEADGINKSDLRSDFRDTATFLSIETGDDGKGTASFKLPDNITSWRITMSAISKELHAGSEIKNVTVTLPFFVNYSFNTSYLKGDKPVIGVNAYGTGITEDDTVYFEVYDEENPDTKVIVKGKAFERINIPLWTFEEGYYNLIIRAYTESGLSDAVMHPVNVYDSYYQIERAEFMDVTPNMEIKGGEQGFTSLVFQDRSNGLYYKDLVNLYYALGNRLDQITSRYLASQLIEEYFDENWYLPKVIKPDISDYQKTAGGLSLFPYSDADFNLTVKFAVFAKDMANTEKLKEYFRRNANIHSNRVKALYGLSVLGEPVLLELNQIENIDNLSITDTIYLALAYYKLGDISKASEIYNERITPYIEKLTPYYRINAKTSKDDIIEATALCAYLAALLERPEGNGLYEYFTVSASGEVLMNIEKLLFISEDIKNLSPEDVEFTYSYNGEEKTVYLEKGKSFSIKLLPIQLKNFKITSVKGDVSLVSVFKENVFDIKEKSDEISISRSYHHLDGTPLYSNTLKQGDIIRVTLTWKVNDTVFDGVYAITDYLPSGLKPYHSWHDTGSQEITFYVYNSQHWKSNTTIKYLARVVSPGVYTAQGPIIQSTSSRDIINSGKTQTVTIETDELISTPIDPPPVIPEPEKILYGDIDGDGEISSIDYSVLMRYLLEIIKELPVQKEAADLNGDGIIDSLDLTLLRRYLLVYIDKFPVEER